MPQPVISSIVRFVHLTNFYQEYAMKHIILFIMSLVFTLSAIADNHAGPQAAELSKSDLSGNIFSRADMLETTHGAGHVTQDVTSLLSSDGKFASGMYKSGKTVWHVTEPYGVDEFMFFLEGSIKLTSTDGTVQIIEAGEGVTIPKEWTGVGETDGYTKIWVIYSEDGSALQ